MPATPLIELDNVAKHYPVRRLGGFGSTRDWIRAVDGVSLLLHSGRTLGVVGESGCGKSTTLRLLLGIEAPTTGSVRFEGAAIDALSSDSYRRFRRSIQAVFQDPWGSLNPRMRVERIVAEPLVASGAMNVRDGAARARELLVKVGLQVEHAALYPHEFSGGQRQRIAIARALALQPRIIVLDEPVSALDVSIRAQVINLLLDLQDSENLSYLFVAHQLSTVWSVSDEVAVMYRGRVVEHGDSDAIRQRPAHPYTQALFAAALPAHPRDRDKALVVADEAPDGDAEMGGCAFRTRCPHAMAACAAAPDLREVAPAQWAACHLHRSISTHQ